LVSFNQTIGAAPAKPKGPAFKPKDPVNLDPEVIAVQGRVDSILAEIRALKGDGKVVPQDLIDLKSEALRILKEAKASFRERSL